MEQSFDYIIVGQGLAGSALAIQMKSQNRKLLVIDKADSSTSSHIAAGLFNPVTGKKMGKTWMAEALFPYLRKFYKNAEWLTGEKFLLELPIYRPFLSAGEQNEWIGSGDASCGSFLRSIATTPQRPDLLHDPYGGLMLDQGGVLNTSAYIAAVRRWLRKEANFIEEEFDYSSCRIMTDKVEYKGNTAAAIVFCDGIEGRRNPFFSWLPVIPLKGEIIAVRGKFFNDLLVNRGIYVVPAGDNEWRVGSTYQHHFDHPGITETARKELLQRLNALVKVPFECTGQYAGIRPTTPDRRPILGIHPEYQTAYIFNGLGTKGVSLSPYFSEALLHYIENKTPPVKEVDISRYYSLYWNSR